jgi:cytoskeletal protein CcmA (bactofilin family)
MFTRRDPNDPEQVTSQSRTTPGLASQQAGGPDAESIIAQEDTFEGQIKTTTGVRVMGTVRGTIESQRSVRIEAGARVEADISAEEVVIAGTYSGSLTCRNRVEITSSARVSGKLETDKLHLHEGGFFDGELRMKRPDEPARATETEEPRPRRSRYVDLSSDTPRATETSSGDGERKEETTA